MFLIDTDEGRIVTDEELKHKMSGEHPYRLWLDEQLVKLEDLPEPPHVHEPDHKTVLHRQQAFGYTFEDLRIFMEPMARTGVEPVGSMGTDTPLAVLSNRPQSLYSYFKQLFAQVTNPPIDCIREELIMGTDTTLGSERNLLKPEPESAHQIKLKTPILDNEELAMLRHINGHLGFKAVDITMLFNPSEGGKGLEKALQSIFQKASKAIAEGINLIILSDRGLNKDLAPIPSLLAVSGLHHHLIREETRTRVGIIVETGEPREVHHYALLIGYGAGAINPYLAFETLDDLIHQGMLKDIEHKNAVKNYIKAVTKGVVKVISKMGISTIQSYRGAQIF
jgi:glutamate synthase (ferredoxin)